MNNISINSIFLSKVNAKGQNRALVEKCQMKALRMKNKVLHLGASHCVKYIPISHYYPPCPQESPRVPKSLSSLLL
jgi:hypothetical protein